MDAAMADFGSVLARLARSTVMENGDLSEAAGATELYTFSLRHPLPFPPGARLAACTVTATLSVVLREPSLAVSRNT